MRSFSPRMRVVSDDSASSSTPARAREQARGVGKRQVLELLDEPDRVAALAAAEALVEAAIGMHVERRRLLTVERAQARRGCDPACGAARTRR